MRKREVRKRIHCGAVLSLAVILIAQPLLAMARPGLGDSTDSHKGAAPAATRNAVSSSATTPGSGSGKLPALKRINRQVDNVTGESTTLLPDGRIVRIGGIGPDGPLTGAVFSDARTGEVFQAVGTISRPRSWHTATLLPNGNILLAGGLDPAGQQVDPPEIFNVETLAFELVTDSGLSPRSHHTATLLTEGLVMIAGGKGPDGKALDTAELWDYRTRTATPVPGRLLNARYDHAASLLADGRVILWQGTGRGGARLAGGELFDPPSRTFAAAETYPAVDDGPCRLAGSLPQDGASAVAVESVIALRFSARVKMESVTLGSVSLAGPRGQVPASVVPAESGMLAFITPVGPLDPASQYTVTAAGLLDSGGAAVQQATFSFITAADAAPPPSLWIPDDRNYRGDWTSNFPPSPWQSYPPLQGTPGATALAGQVLRFDGWPLPGVVMKIKSISTVTDETGRFVLSGVPQGRNTLIVDCRPASTAGATYGFFMEAVDVPKARVTNALQYTIFMPVLDTRNAIPLESPTRREVVAKTPTLPGLEVHIPKKAVLRNVDGDPIKSMTITPVPIDRGPFPLPLGVKFPVYFTLQLGGTTIESPSGEAPPGMFIVFPNYAGAAPGTKIDFYTYDAAGIGWFPYGHGTVTDDAKQIVPDPGVVIHLFTCASVGGPGDAPGTAPVVCSTCGTGGDPCDLCTGLFVYRQTDIVLQDVIPIVLTRTYRTNDTGSRPFGIGASHPYQLFLVGDQANYTYVDLILQDGARIHFNRTSPGTQADGATFVHTSTPTAFYQSTLTGHVFLGPSGTNHWDLKLKDGTLLQFSSRGVDDALLTLIQDRNGNRISIIRNQSNQGPASEYITSITTQNGRWVQFSYDSSYRVTQLQDNIGRTVSYAYDSGGRLSQVTDAGGGITQYTYDTANRMLTIKDPRQIVYLTNQYDANGRIQQQTMANGGTYQFAFTVDGSNNVTQTNLTDPNGHIRQVGFNSSGYVVSQTGALGLTEQQTVTFTRQAGSNFVQSTTDGLNRTTGYEYDLKGNLTSVTLLSGTSDAVSTSFTYEPNFNQLTSITDPLQHTISMAVDTKGNTISITDPLNNRVLVSNNVQGQPVTVTDPLNNVWQLGYNSGDLTSVTNPLGQSTSRFLDGAGRVLSVSDALGNRVRVSHDNLDRPTGMTGALGDLVSFSYDANSNLVGVTDPRNNTIGYSYNNLDLVASHTDSLMHSDGYEYDAEGMPTRATDRKGQVTSYQYDGLDRLSKITFNDQSSISYIYDGGNRVTEAVDSVSGAIGYSFDGLDRITSAAAPNGTISYSYDNANRRATMTVPGQSGTSYVYDNADRLMQITQGAASVSFTYDAAGRRSSMTLPNGVSVAYAYDIASRLTGISYSKGPTGLGNLTYGYDNAGRRVSVGGTLSRTSLPQAVQSANYDAANRQIGFGSQSLVYDLNGNLTSDGIKTYTWNARDQLVGLSGPALAASFQYDSAGRRLDKTINGATTSFLYDGLNLVQEQTGSTISANLLTGGLDEFFQRTDSSGAAHPLADAIQSVLAFTDSAGSITTQYTYDPFGSTSVSGATSSSSLQYTGRENDGTGLSYYRNRYYSSGSERFIGEDPAGYFGGINLYAYAENSPAMWTDPLGLYTEVIIWAPVGHGESSFGHVSVIINGTSYSWGPGERGGILKTFCRAGHMDRRSADLYLAMNTAFRSGEGLILNLSADQEQKFQSYLNALADDPDPPTYNAFYGNCASPVREGLERVDALRAVVQVGPHPGMQAMLNMTPAEFQHSLEMQPGLISGHTYHNRGN